MTKKSFEDRLKSIADKHAETQSSAASEQERRRKTEEEQVAKLHAAIRVWKEQVAPRIAQAVAQTNELIGTKTGVWLSAASTEATHIVFGRVGPPVPPTPSIIIAAHSETSQKRSVAGRIAGAAAPRKATLKDFAQSPRLQIGLDADATLTIMPLNYKSEMHKSIDLHNSTEAIHNAIVEFVEVVVARHTQK